MAKTTYVYLGGIWKYNSNSHTFRMLGDNPISKLWVEGVKDGIVTVEPGSGDRFNDFAEAVVGCFNDDSNFGTEVLRTYDCDENDTFNGIKFTFNGVTLIVTKENADMDVINKEWKAKANIKKHRCEKET